jgi:hypothetical protein
MLGNSEAMNGSNRGGRAVSATGGIAGLRWINPVVVGAVDNP